jgi:AbiV family abortive infection protein
LTKNINIRKIYKLQTLVLKNALRLNHDSIILFNNDSFPSAYFMSAIALEEIGKLFYLDDFIYHFHCGHLSGKDFSEYYSKVIYSHSAKQQKNAIEFRFEISEQMKNLMQNGNIEKNKHKHLYVGLPKIKNKVDIKGKIQEPFTFNKEKITKQITLINDQLLYLSLGLFIGTLVLSGLNINNYKDFINKQTIEQLFNAWPHRNKGFTKVISNYTIEYQKIKSLSDDEYIEWLNN